MPHTWRQSTADQRGTFPVGAVALMVGAALSYAVALPAAKAALVHLSPLQVLFWTRIVGVVVWGVAHAFRHARAPTNSDARALRAGSTLGVLLFSSYALLLIGLQTTAASTAGVILGLYIVATPLVDRIVTHEPVRGSTLVAAGICTIGVAVAAGQARGASLAVLLIVGAALLTSLHTVVLAAAAKRWTAKDLIGTQTAVAGLLAFAALRGNVDAVGALHAAPLLLVAGIFPPLIAAGAQIRAQRRLTASFGATVLALEPLSAALLAVALLDEPFTLNLAVGGILVAGGIAIALLAQR